MASSFTSRCLTGMCALVAVPGLVAVLSAVAVQGCANAERLEVTNTECGDDDDNDGNGLTDCEDPSCRGTRACAFPRKLDTDATVVEPPSMPHDAGSDGHVAPPPPPESGTDADVPAPTDPGDASMPDASPDVPDASDCQNDCPTEPPETLSVKLRITAARVPNVSTTFIPFDIPLFYSDNERSGTGPDPFVSVLLNGVPLFDTTWVMDTLDPSWTEPGIRFDISRSDKLEFEVYDYDGPNPDYPPKRMFECAPELPLPIPEDTGATIECTYRVSNFVRGVLEHAL